MRKWKTVLFILLTIALVAVSYFIGSLIGFQKGIRAGGMTTSMAELWLFQGHWTAQRANADCEGIKKTLNDFILILDKYHNVEGTILSDRRYLFDKMATHARLALIERKLGHESAARDHIRVALEFCAKLDWKECSEEKIFSVIKRIDQKNPIACLSDG